MDLATFLVQCLNAVQYGLLLFLVASGLTLIFGIMGVINLAHGSFYMIGAYLAFVLAPWFGDWYLSKLLAGVILAALLASCSSGLFSYLYERDHPQQVLMTYALILVFEELLRCWSATIACSRRPRCRARCRWQPDDSIGTPVRLGRLHQKAALAMYCREQDAARHDDPRRRQQTTWCAAWCRHPAVLPASCRLAVWRWRRWPV